MGRSPRGRSFGRLGVEQAAQLAQGAVLNRSHGDVGLAEAETDFSVGALAEKAQDEDLAVEAGELKERRPQVVAGEVVVGAPGG